MESNRPRKLAVILHADVVGSTTLVRRDERLAHERIQDAFRRFSATIESYDGHPLELRGDALVAEFNRASDAVQASLAFQAENSRFNSALEDDIRPSLRVGISLGEVVVADNTVTGEGVVLAQRLEQLASDGGVCIQGAVFEAVPGRLPFEYRNLGEQKLKGFSDPLRAYAVSLKSGETIPPPEAQSVFSEAEPGRPEKRWIMVGAVVLLAVLAGGFAWHHPWAPTDEPASTEGTAPTLTDKPSIAVLPFDNMSDDQEQEYFADGLTEDLITDLSKLSGLHVIARTSSFVYRGKDFDVRQAAQELSVRYVLEGSVRKAGDRVRINAQLIDATTGGHVWAERYDRQLIDIFDLQNEVIERIVAALAVKLTPQESERVAYRSTNNVTAYDHFLRGQALVRTVNYPQAREEYEQAIAVDPGFARAYGALSITHTFAVQFGWSADPQSDKERALTLAKKAVAIDDNVPQVHYALGYAYLINRSHNDAISELRRAIELDPGYADGFSLLAWIHCHAGEPQEALRVLQMAERLSPRSNAGTLVASGAAHFLMGQLEEAIKILRAARDANPELGATHIYLTAALSRSGRQDDAEWQALELLSLNPDFSVERWAATAPYKDPIQRDRLREDLLRAGLPG